MAKLERRNLMFFAGFLADGENKSAPGDVGWEPLGRDNDDLSKDLNPDTESGKNVLGEATFKVKGFEPSVNVDPYYVDDESPMYAKLKAAAVQELHSDANIKGYFVEATYSSATATTLTGTGFMREAYIVPQSTGGDTAGFGIPIEVHPVGPMTEVNVVYTLATRAVSITTPTGGG